MSTIRELEEKNAALRAAVAERNARLATDDPKRIGMDLPAEVLSATAGYTLTPATPAAPLVIRPHMVASTIPPALLEATWAGVKARQGGGAVLDVPVEPQPSMRDVPVIGLTGRAGAGKNLVASLIPDCVVVQFADPIYAMVATMLGVAPDDLRDRDVKESPVGWIGKSPRELLQTLGTEWGRQIVRDDIWIIMAKRRIERLEHHDGPVVIADVRFDNEAEMIRAKGGEVWQVVRSGDDTAPWHSSEAGISPALIDITIVNDGTVADLRRAVDAALT